MIGITSRLIEIKHYLFSGVATYQILAFHSGIDIVGSVIDAIFGIFERIVDEVDDEIGSAIADPLIEILIHTPLPKRCPGSAEIGGDPGCAPEAVEPAIIQPPENHFWPQIWEWYWELFLPTALGLGIMVYVVINFVGTWPFISRKYQKRISGGIPRTFAGLVFGWPIMMFSLYLMDALNKSIAPTSGSGLDKFRFLVSTVISGILTAGGTPFAPVAVSLGLIDVILVALTMVIFVGRFMYMIIIPAIAPLLITGYFLRIPVFESIAKSLFTSWVKLGVLPMLVGGAFRVAAFVMVVDDGSSGHTFRGLGEAYGGSMSPLLWFTFGLLIPAIGLGSTYFVMSSSLPSPVRKTMSTASGAAKTGAKIAATGGAGAGLSTMSQGSLSGGSVGQANDGDEDNQGDDDSSSEDNGDSKSSKSSNLPATKSAHGGTSTPASSSEVEAQATPETSPENADPFRPSQGHPSSASAASATVVQGVSVSQRVGRGDNPLESISQEFEQELDSLDEGSMNARSRVLAAVRVQYYMNHEGRATERPGVNIDIRQALAGNGQAVSSGSSFRFSNIPNTGGPNSPGDNNPDDDSSEPMAKGSGRDATPVPSGGSTNGNSAGSQSSRSPPVSSGSAEMVDSTVEDQRNASDDDDRSDSGTTKRNSSTQKTDAEGNTADEGSRREPSNTEFDRGVAAHGDDTDDNSSEVEADEGAIDYPNNRRKESRPVRDTSDEILHSNIDSSGRAANGTADTVVTGRDSNPPNRSTETGSEPEVVSDESDESNVPRTEHGGDVGPSAVGGSAESSGSSGDKSIEPTPSQSSSTTVTSTESSSSSSIEGSRVARGQAEEPTDRNTGTVVDHPEGSNEGSGGLPPSDPDQSSGTHHGPSSIDVGSIGDENVSEEDILVGSGSVEGNGPTSETDSESVEVNGSEGDVHPTDRDSDSRSADGASERRSVADRNRESFDGSDETDDVDVPSTDYDAGVPESNESGFEASVEDDNESSEN